MIDRYRREFADNHPELSIDAAELGVRGFDGAYYFQWPMIADLIGGARLTVSHSRGAAAALAEAWPASATGYLPLGEGRETPLSEDQRADVRRGLGIAHDTVLVGVFGALTSEKRVLPIIHALAATHAHAPDVRLLLCGTPDDAGALHQALGAGGLTSRVHWVEYARRRSLRRRLSAQST